MVPTDSPLVWYLLCDLQDLPTDDTGLTVELGRRRFAVFRVGEQVRILADTCPHAGGSLGAGVVVDNEVTCPWHALHFDLCSGANTEGLELGVRAYPARLVGARQVQVGLSEREATGGALDP